MTVDSRWYDDYDSSDMEVVASNCHHFSPRNDVSSFNMINYQSCENCNRLTAENECIYNRGNRSRGYAGTGYGASNPRL